MIKVVILELDEINSFIKIILSAMNNEYEPAEFEDVKNSISILNTNMEKVIQELDTYAKRLS